MFHSEIRRPGYLLYGLDQYYTGLAFLFVEIYQNLSTTTAVLHQIQVFQGNEKFENLEDDMEKDNTNKTTKIQNQFSAYLQSFVQGRRRDYLVKKINILDAEQMSEQAQDTKMKIEFEELLEMHQKNERLQKEMKRNYLKWDEMSDQQLVEALAALREDERRLIYQHVFEERTFVEMSRLNGLSEDRIKGIYYYAIRKIRKMMGGENLR